MDPIERACVKLVMALFTDIVCTVSSLPAAFDPGIHEVPSVSMWVYVGVELASPGSVVIPPNKPRFSLWFRSFQIVAFSDRRGDSC